MPESSTWPVPKVLDFVYNIPKEVLSIYQNLRLFLSEKFLITRTITKLRKFKTLSMAQLLTDKILAPKESFIFAH